MVLKVFYTIKRKLSKSKKIIYNSGDVTEEAYGWHLEIINVSDDKKDISETTIDGNLLL